MTFKAGRFPLMHSTQGRAEGGLASSLGTARKSFGNNQHAFARAIYPSALRHWSVMYCQS